MLVPYKPRKTVNTKQLVVYKPNKQSKALTKPNSKTIAAKNNKYKPSVPRMPMGRSKFIAMKYTWANSMSTAGTVDTVGNEYGFEINNINSPYQGQINTDPLPQGFAQVQSYFERFKVLANKFHITVGPNTTGKDVVLAICLNNYNSNLVLTGTTQQQNDQRYGVWFYHLPTDKPFNFSKYVGIGQLEGLTKSQFANDISGFYSGTINSSVAALGTSSPTRVCRFKIGLLNMTDGTSVSIPFSVNMIYYTNLVGRARQATSLSTA